MTPAEMRVRELVDKWLTSLELHLKYAALDDAAYQQVQPWPPHQRPARWIVELARARATDLKHQLEVRTAAGDSGFAETIELMGFLTNLVGAQNVERFIPLAEPGLERATPATTTAPTPTTPEPHAPDTREPVAAATHSAPTPDESRAPPFDFDVAHAPTAASGDDLAALSAAFAGHDEEPAVAEAEQDEDEAGTLQDEVPFADAEPLAAEGIDDPQAAGEGFDDVQDVADDEEFDAAPGDDGSAGIVVESLEDWEDADVAEQTPAVGALPLDEQDPAEFDDTGESVADHVLDDAEVEAELLAGEPEDAELGSLAADVDSSPAAAAARVASGESPVPIVAWSTRVPTAFGPTALWSRPVAPAPYRSGSTAHTLPDAPATVAPPVAAPVAPPVAREAAAPPPDALAPPPTSAAAPPQSVIPAPTPAVADAPASVSPAPPPTASAVPERPARAASPPPAPESAAPPSPPPRPLRAPEPKPKFETSPPVTLAALEARMAPPRTPAPRAAARRPSPAPVPPVSPAPRAAGPHPDAHATPSAPATPTVATAAAPSARAADTSASATVAMPAPAPLGAVKVPTLDATAMHAGATARLRALHPDISETLRARLAAPDLSPTARERLLPADLGATARARVLAFEPAARAAGPAPEASGTVAMPAFRGDRGGDDPLAETGRHPALRGADVHAAEARLPTLDTPRMPPGKSRKDKSNRGGARAPAPGASPEQTVIADAVRLLGWGKAWHELAEAIARMAGRPTVGEVRKLLRAHKAEIERQIRR
jgi:hypothetical protein